MSTKIKLFFTLCLLSIQSVFGMNEFSVAPREELDLILQSKHLSFTAILAFQDENFERSSEYFLKSLELRKQFQFGSVAYMNILKLYLHSENNKGGSSICSSYFTLSYKDKVLLEKESDIQEMLKNCE
jgi:hypothetical protein